MENASYLVAGCRTPVGKFFGALSTVAAPQLGARVVAEVLRRAGIAPEAVDEVILGNVLSAGLGQAPARQAALAAGLPASVAAYSINKVCGSGLKAVMLADQAIRSGDARVVVAGGMENMTLAPHLLPRSRMGWKFGHQQTVDSMIHDGLWCAIENESMGDQAEYIARTRNISRADQDAYALESHRRAVAARDAGWFRDEIVPIDFESRPARRMLDTDEGPRADSTLERLAALKPAFDDGGTVTAGNASPLSDGAAAVAVVDAETARGARSPLTARIVATAATGVKPKEIFIAPASALRAVLEKASLGLDDVDLVEMNEAFAAQALAVIREVGLDPAKTNVHGGAIALGHPIGASGARILVTLLHALARGNLKRGIATLCLGGGNAVAMLVERR
jgi:acetyl-CoA C-acetyltransferase